MRRREVISLLVGAGAWPLAARAQEAAQMRRVGMLSSYAERDPQIRTWIEAFVVADATIRLDRWQELADRLSMVRRRPRIDAGAGERAHRVTA
jgi:hypothetical protein